TPIVSNSRRAAATIAEARASFGVRPSAGSATVTENEDARPWRSAMASARPAKPAPPISTSVRCTLPADEAMRVLLAKTIALSSPGPADDDGPRAATRSANVVCRSRSPCHPRSRATRGKPVPWALATGRLAARVRRAGDRASAGRRLPHGGRRRAAATLAARLFPAPRRPQGADHLRGRPHPRRHELHYPPRRRHPARTGDFHHGGVVSSRRARHEPPGADTRGGEAGAAAERSRHQGARAAADARSGAPLLRARAADRMATGGARPLSRQKDRERPLPCLDPRHCEASR